MSERTLLASVDEGNRTFQAGLFTVASLLMSALSLVAGAYYMLALDQARSGASALLFALPSLATLLAARRGQAALAAQVFVLGVFGALTLALFLSGVASANLALPVFCLLMVVAGATISPRLSLLLGGATILTLIAFGLHGRFQLSRPDALADLIPQLSLVALFALVVSSLSLQSRSLTEQLRRRLTSIDETIPDLLGAGKRMAAAAAEIHTTSSQQREGAFRQSSAVRETREALHSTLSASREIAKSARAVYDNAQSTSRNSEQVAGKVEVLADQARRIAVILESIREIANKTELLSLNASLESTRAGDAGRGFSLVASEMQKLSERVVSSVHDIKTLTTEIRESTQGVQLSIEDMTKLAKATTDAGREISLVTQQQQTSTEQVTSAMDDIAEITNQAAVSSEQTQASIEELKNVAGDVPRLIDKLTAA